VAGVEPLIESSWDRDSSLYWDDQGYESADIDGTAIKRGLAVPIAAHGRRYGVLVVRNTKKGFRFVEKDSKLLRQFVHILAMALENSFMMEQIEWGRYELRMLAGKIISVKEEERRRLASDIHDTVAQELSGIGYKLEFCIELAKRAPEKVSDELECLTQAVQDAIGHCRKLISELRPDLIDTIGLIPALKRFVRNYHEETGIRVECRFPENIQLPGHLSICLFRVVQEALANIHKHARSETALIEVTQPIGRVHLIVSDRGEGFEMTPNPPWVNNPDKLGLLYMRERVESLGGSLNIRTSAGRGCSLEVKIPCGEENLGGRKDTGSDR
jgi:two-component system sensor histidine kinase DegS